MRRAAPGNQAKLRSRAARTACACCDERKDREGPNSHADRETEGTAVAERPSMVDVWGLPVTRAMCKCKSGVVEDIDWANEIARTYAACNTAANSSSTMVEACVDAAQPTSTIAATTSPSGAMTLPPPSTDPCKRIKGKASFVHETMHARTADAIARAQGTAFFSAWQGMAGDKDRLTTLEARFPAEVAAFAAEWRAGSAWAQDEVNSYKWQRRFLEATLQALNRIC
jgi:CRISPR/Cas system CMR-associated protein Cmr5 small subunit